MDEKNSVKQTDENNSTPKRADKKMHIGIWAPVEFCVFFYEKIYNLMVRILKEKYVDKVPVRIWTAICGIILFVLYAFIDNMVYWEHYKYYVMVTMAAVYLICIVMVAARNVPDKHKEEAVAGNVSDKLDNYAFVHNKLLWVFIVMSFLMMVSEYFINQERGFIGQFNILAIGFLAYVMFRTGNQKLLQDAVIWSVAAAFCMLAVRILFFEAGVDGARNALLGIYENRSWFASVLVPAVAVAACMYAAHLNEKFRDDGRSSAYSVCSFVITGVLQGITVMFMVKSSCRTGIVFVILVYTWQLFADFIRKKINAAYICKMAALWLIAALAWQAGVYAINEVALRDSNYSINNYSDCFTETVNASGWQDSLAQSKTALNKLSSGRTEYYLAYIKNLNAIGHMDYCYIEKYKSYEPAHNSIIGIYYKYGYVVGGFYFVFAMLVIYEAFCYNKHICDNREKYGSLILNIILGFVCFAMLDTMDERPFFHIIWVLGYIAVAVLMSSRAVMTKCAAQQSADSSNTRRIYIAVLVFIAVLYVFKAGYKYMQQTQAVREAAPYSIVLEDYADKSDELKELIDGAYDIEGSPGSLQLWMQSRVSTVIRRDSECTKLYIRGYIPYDSYGLEEGTSIKVTVSVNGKKILSGKYTDDAMFEAEADWSQISGKYADVRVKVSKSFVPSKVGDSGDVRELSWLFAGIIQE